MRIHVLIGLMMTILLASCEKEETPVVLPSKPDAVSLISVDLGPSYKNQVFVNLSTGQQTIIPIDCWDLAFEASAEGQLIYMNGGNSVLIANVGSGKFKTNLNLNSLNWRWDAPSGTSDSLVLNHCFNETTHLALDSIYVINRGKGNSPENYFQFKLLSVSPTAYTISIANVDGDVIHDNLTIPKDNNKYQVYFSFDDDGKILNVEPPKSDWHFTFLRYRFIYHEFSPPLHYQVTGVYSNTSLVEIAVDSSMVFYDIQAAQTSGLSYSSQRDVIGYDWKTPNFKPSGVEYEIRKHVNYIVREKTGNNRSYKLRFLDFYNDKGQKGSPRFELQQFN